MVVVARLKPGAHERAAQLLEHGPPFDPHVRGLRRHAVYLSSEEVVFVFGGREANWIVEDLVTGFPSGEIVRALESWRPLIEGHPRLAREMYFWEEGVR